MTDQFQWWREALAGKAGPINANEPQSGYFKMRKGKDGPWLPVAIWRNNNDELVCRVADDVRDPHDVWTWAAGNPVAKDDAKQAFDTGKWPGDVPAIGHNSGDLSLAEEITEARAQALQWLTTSGITDKTTADMAANYRAKLLDLSKRADAERDSKVRPHLDAQKAINAEYKPLVEDAKAAADTLRAALSKYLAAEEAKARAEAERKAREENERRMAEYKRQQEEAAKAAPKDEPPLPLEAPVFVAPEPVKLQAGGQRGKKASLRTILRYEVADYAAALEWAKDHPDVRAAVEKVACATARLGNQVPGVRSYEEKVAV